MKYLNTYVVYDFETTGLIPQKNEVTEIGALLVVNGEIKDSRSWLLKVTGEYPEEVQKITGITKDLLDAEGIDPKTAWEEFSKFVAGYTLVGQNIMRSDNLFVDVACKKYGVEIKTLRCVDTAALYKASILGVDQMWYENHADFAMRVLNIREKVHYNLTAAYTALGGSMDGVTAHRASADVLMAHYVFQKLCHTH